MEIPPIRTPRYELVAMSRRFMESLLARDIPRAEAEIGAIVPAGLADELDDYLRDVLADPRVDEPRLAAWLGRATVLTEPDGTRRIIGSCGFHAPPGADGWVEVGCSVEATHRRRGVGTEVLEGLFDWAGAHGVDRFRASILPDNVASIAMVEPLGFRQVGVEIDSVDGEVLIFELDGWPGPERVAAGSVAERMAAGRSSPPRP